MYVVFTKLAHRNPSTYYLLTNSNEKILVMKLFFINSFWNSIKSLAIYIQHFILAKKLKATQYHVKGLKFETSFLRVLVIIRKKKFVRNNVIVVLVSDLDNQLDMNVQIHLIDFKTLSNCS